MPYSCFGSSEDRGSDIHPACDSPRGFIEANMGLVGMLWGRTNQITETKVQYHSQALPVLCRVKIGVLMYYPACDSGWFVMM